MTALILVMLLAQSGTSDGNTVLHIPDDFQISTLPHDPAKSVVTPVLPPGYYVPDSRWAVLDDELKRLQTAETRLAAENVSLRSKSAGQVALIVVCISTALTAGLLIGRLSH